MYLTDAQFRDDAAARLAEAGLGAALGVPQVRVADQSHRAAYDLIRLTLINRGYTAAEIDAWPQGQTFERYIGLYNYFTDGSLGTSYPQEAIDKLAKWLDLLEKVPAAPPLPTGGGIGHGGLDGSGLRFGRERWRG